MCVSRYSRCEKRSFHMWHRQLSYGSPAWSSCGAAPQLTWLFLLQSTGCYSCSLKESSGCLLSFDTLLRRCCSASSRRTRRCRTRTWRSCPSCGRERRSWSACCVSRCPPSFWSSPSDEGFDDNCVPNSADSALSAWSPKYHVRPQNSAAGQAGLIFGPTAGGCDVWYAQSARCIRCRE